MAIVCFRFCRDTLLDAASRPQVPFATLFWWRRRRRAVNDCGASGRVRSAVGGKWRCNVGLVLLAGLLFHGAFTSAAADPVLTNEGLVQGVSVGQVEEFLGVPFATPAVGGEFVV